MPNYRQRSQLLVANDRTQIVLLRYIVRSETWAGMEATVPRVIACME